MDISWHVSSLCPWKYCKVSFMKFPNGDTVDIIMIYYKHLVLLSHNHNTFMSEIWRLCLFVESSFHSRQRRCSPFCAKCIHRLMKHWSTCFSERWISYHMLISAFPSNMNQFASTARDATSLKTASTWIQTGNSKVWERERQRRYNPILDHNLHCKAKMSKKFRVAHRIPIQKCHQDHNVNFSNWDPICFLSVLDWTWWLLLAGFKYTILQWHLRSTLALFCSSSDRGLWCAMETWKIE